MIFNLSNRALLRVVGIDASDFLHKQLSNDIANISDKVVQLNAYCSHKGRVIALLRVFKIKDSYYLDLAKDLLQVVKKRLQMFVLNSQVIIEDISDKLALIGFLGQKPDTSLGDVIEYSSNQSAVLTNINNLDKIISSDINYWYFNNIKLGLPEIFLTTSEVFIPQMLNLDLVSVNGVNFDKGCYPGQEVVARVHYLGKANIRMFKFKLRGLANIGDKLQIDNSSSTSSNYRVVLSANIDGNTYCLATIKEGLLNNRINLNDSVLEVIND